MLVQSRFKRIKKKVHLLQNLTNCSIC